MSRPIFSDEAFAAWLEKQPAEEKYDYTDRSDCLVLRYLRSIGLDVVDVVYNCWYDSKNNKREFPSIWQSAARHDDRHGSPRDWTYGAALRRLRAHMEAKAAA